MTHSVWPWKTFTEWMEGSLKSQRRKVVSREEVTTSRWVGCVQQCVSSWSCPTTKDDKNARSSTCRHSYKEAFQKNTRINKQSSWPPMLVHSTKVNVKSHLTTAQWHHSATAPPSGVGSPSLAFKGSREMGMSVIHFLILTEGLASLFNWPCV